LGKTRLLGIVRRPAWTCKLNEVEPQAYFADVLEKLVNLSLARLASRRPHALGLGGGIPASSPPDRLTITPRLGFAPPPLTRTCQVRTSVWAEDRLRSEALAHESVDRGRKTGST
jgi:hypothetical protein